MDRGFWGKQQPGIEVVCCVNRENCAGESRIHGEIEIRVCNAQMIRVDDTKRMEMEGQLVHLP